MTDKDIIRLVKDTYDVNPGVKGRSFIREHTKRKIHLSSIIMMQFKELNPLTIIITICISVMGVLLTFIKNYSSSIWVCSSIMPLAALIITADLGRSKRHQMTELEMVTRFSLRMQKSVRIFIGGVLGIIIHVLIIPFLSIKLGIAPCISVLALGCPYLFTSWGCMLITRKYHNSENIYGCTAIAMSAAIIPIMVKTLLGQINTGLIATIGFILLIILFVAITTEIRKYLQEDRNTTWNLN